MHSGMVNYFLIRTHHSGLECHALGKVYQHGQSFADSANTSTYQCFQGAVQPLRMIPDILYSTRYIPQKNENKLTPESLLLMKISKMGLIDRRCTGRPRLDKRGYSTMGWIARLRG